ncbi:MAG: hypothetical protein IMZ61_05520, partial [Planctomycetes bacterium]|nr:hypothetical protein [Planctomycetota bacterium]
MSDLKRRVKQLQARTTDDEIIVWIDWGGPTVNIKGVEMTREEVDRLYP